MIEDNDKGINSLPLGDNELFAENNGKVVIVSLTTQNEPVHGRLLRASKLFIVLQRRNGSVISVSKSVITSLRPIKHQMQADHQEVI